MNPFLNPITSTSFIRDLIFDPGRLQRLTPEKIRRYRDKAFRRALIYAYKVPLYHKKYREAGIHPNDVKGIKDITKLPFIKKRDLIEHFPDGIVPTGYNKDKAHIIRTSGSTGKPLSLYIDFSTMSKFLVAYVRKLRIYNLNWRKIRFANIGNFTTNHIDLVFHEGFKSKMRPFFSFKNNLIMNGFDPIYDIIKKLDEFKPDIVLSYPATFRLLAFLKRKGHGKNINPEVALVSGSVTDEYTKSYVEDAFNCRMLNVYGSTESGMDIAFECFERIWHINYDFYHVEAIDKNMEVVSQGERGHIALTRMFGMGTPIIRYIGMDDWVTLRSYYKCPCGLHTPIIEGGVKGRISADIFLPNGRLFSAASFASMSHFVLHNLKTYKVKQFQIIQKKIDEIDILLVIDENLRDSEPAVDFIFKKLKEVYKEKTGPEININVKEVKEIKSPFGKPAPVVISHVKPEVGYEIIEARC